MDIHATKPNPILRQLACLKVVSRLLGYELHAQGTSKTVTLSREELTEIQTTLELHIEEVARRFGHAASAGGLTQPVEAPLVSTRN